ncbi:MAG: hypothetical protein Q4F97_06680 [Bacteroidales bacterium]|nr:hypothetical protein [Bacteroidales bacterium]
MQSKKIYFLSIVFVLSHFLLNAQKVNSDFWSATDALGRKVSDYNIAGDKKKDKYVAMFYWTWHQGIDDTTYQVKNITEIVRKHPEAMKDYHHPAWGNKQPGFFFWEQPLLGYYKTTDKWVLRKHAEMLADAGVDAVFFDCTNGSLTWKESYEALMETWDKAQNDGVDVPKIAFMLPFGPLENSLVSLRQLYNDVYKSKKYQNLWFYWKGKPCIMAYPDNLSNSGIDKEIKNFFTFRPGQPDYVDGPKRNDQWGWLENYPQHGYVKQDNGTFEEVTVGVAQNASPETKGHCSAFNLEGAHSRSYSVKNGFDPRVDSYLYGWNFQEQWDRAFELQPELVFITGWNEYIAGQWQDPWTGIPFSFVDQYNWDCSRDIEPNKGWGDKGDVYYYQLVDNVRKFKGMNKPENVSKPKNIDIKNFKDWESVSPYFSSYKGNTIHRNHRGRYDQYYINNSGRNDIVGAKVARDNDFIYFYVETDNNMTPSSDHNWMMLFIDSDRDKNTGWYGYDFVVNHISPSDNMVVIEKNYKGKWMWNKIAKAEYYQIENKMAIKIARKDLNFDNKKINLEFKWNDNMQDEGDIMDFYVNGDVAPGARFNYVFSEQ